jgi:hypothetical protein
MVQSINDERWIVLKDNESEPGNEIDNFENEKQQKSRQLYKDHERDPLLNYLKKIGHL